jgi:hypothetical protein
LPAKWCGVLGLVIVAVSAFLAWFFCILAERQDLLVLAWIAIFPLGYYFLTYPHEGTVISFDRLTIPAILLAGGFTSTSGDNHGNTLLHRSGIAWTFFLIASLFSLIHMQNPLGGTKLWWDCFVLPAILAFGVIRSLSVSALLSKIHIVTCLFCIYSVTIGLGELFLNTDLLPLPNGTFYAVGETISLIPRVNGPFASNNSYGLIGLIAFFLLLFCRGELPTQLPLWHAALHRLGVISAFLIAVMTLFRSIAITLIVVLIIDIFFVKTFRARAWRFSILGFLGTALLLFQLALPEAFMERSDPANFYARLAQQKQTFAIFLTHPLTGIGLGNFLSFAPEFSGPDSSVEGYGAVDAAHNTLGEIVSETGLFGGVPYILAQVFLILTFWKLSPTAPRIWRFFIYIFLAYWISGMSLSSGYFSDLNLWFMFAIAVLFKVAQQKSDGYHLGSTA